MTEVVDSGGAGRLLSSALFAVLSQRLEFVARIEIRGRSRGRGVNSIKRACGSCRKGEKMKAFKA